MSKKTAAAPAGTPTEFDVMALFVKALPHLEESAIHAMLEWMQARGDSEIESRKTIAIQTSE